MAEKKPTDVKIVETKEPLPVTIEHKRRFSDAVIISAITGVVSIISLWLTLTVKTKVNTVHQQINSRMDELLKVNKEASRAKGFMEGSGTIDSSTAEMDSSKVYKILPVK